MLNQADDNYRIKYEPNLARVIIYDPAGDGIFLSMIDTKSAEFLRKLVLLAGAAVAANIKIIESIPIEWYQYT